MRLPYRTTLTLALALAAFSAAWAQATPVPAPASPGMACPMAKGRGDWTDRFAARLGLNDTQKAGIQAIVARHRDALAGKEMAARAAARAFAEALAKPESRPDELKALQRNQADAQFACMMEQRSLRQEIRALLTPEQREQAARLEGRMEGMRMAHGGACGMRGMGGMGGGHRPWSAPDAPRTHA